MVRAGTRWRRRVRHLLAALLLSGAGAAGAQAELEIIALRHRPVEQVLPALRPLLEAGGSLSGMNHQLFVRASPRNREEIKAALRAIDTPPRRLRIIVAQDRDGQTRAARLGIDGQAAAGGGRLVLPAAPRPPSPPEIGGGTRIEIHRGGIAGTGVAGTTTHHESVQATQTIQVVEGGRAHIQVGRSLPVPFRQVVFGPQGTIVSDTVVWRDVAQGFTAEPRLSGDHVTLDIAPSFDTPGPGHGVQTQRVSTTVSGRLGDWIEVGGSQRAAADRTRGSFSVSQSEDREHRSIWLKIEELP